MEQACLEDLESQTQPSDPGIDVVAQLAHDLWLSRGCPAGSPEEDWYEAERILKWIADKVETSPPEVISAEYSSTGSNTIAVGLQSAA